MLNVTCPYLHAPAELRALPQWLCWRREFYGDRWIKPPYRANRRLPLTTDPNTWHSFDECCAALFEDPDFFDGIGYVFSERDPYFGIDLDAIYRSDAAETPPWANPIISGFKAEGSYIEESPGEDGHHIIGCGRLPEGIKPQWVYQAAQFAGLSRTEWSCTTAPDISPSPDAATASLESATARNS
jgi:primase-polymerase (primpol)-like protein